MKLDPLNIGALLVALIGLYAGWSTQRAAAKAARQLEKDKAENARTSEKDKAETEAYSRARTMDLQTIDRQNDEIKDLLADNIDLRKRDRDQIKEIDRLRTERLALVKQNLRQAEEIRELRRNQNDQ